MRVVAFVSDLMDRSRVAAAIPGAQFVADPAALPAAAEGADLVIVDLARPGALEAALELARGGTSVVAYASHVQTGILEAAGAAGCTPLARSVFFRRLPSLAAQAREGGAPPQ